MSAFVVGILGAESTGKTLLAAGLARALSEDRRLRVAVVSEWLREFCTVRGRTPRIDEQQSIADEQTRRIEAAAADHDIVVADTTSLMIAVYSDWVFGDRTLYAAAESRQARCDATLLTALDLPWQADGHQRDGPHVREPIDALIRASLDRARLPYSIVSGTGDIRLQSALSAIEAARRNKGANAANVEPSPSDAPRPPSRWTTACDRCGDAACELHLFRKTIPR